MARVLRLPAAAVAFLLAAGIVSTIVVSLASESERPVRESRRNAERKAPESPQPDSPPEMNQNKVEPDAPPADQLASTNDDPGGEPAAVPDRREAAEALPQAPSAQSRPATTDVEPPPLRDAKILLLEGTFPARDVLRLYSDLTGLPVLFDAGDTQLLSRTIEIVAPIRDMNEEMLNELLRSNRIALRKKRLRDGRMVVRVRSAEASNDFIDPEPIPIIEVGRR